MREKEPSSTRAQTYKLSYGPYMFVGIAAVKFEPNSSLYAWFAISTRRFACAYPKLLSCGGPRWILSSRSGGSIPSGNTHVDRHETTLRTPVMCDVCSTLSLILILSLSIDNLYFIFMNSPPTAHNKIMIIIQHPTPLTLQKVYYAPSAARWMTCVGLYFAKSALVASASLYEP